MDKGLNNGFLFNWAIIEVLLFIITMMGMVMSTTNKQAEVIGASFFLTIPIIGLILF